MLWIEEICVLSKSLITLVSNINEIWVTVCNMMAYLPPFAVFFQSFDCSLKNISVAQISPSTHQRTLTNLWQVGKSIVVLIVRFVQYIIVT